jgi:sec-independent protein translocase protein TatB
VFNLGAGEVLVILLLALIVLGPQRLPDAARQVGRFTGEIRRLSSGFQQEMKSAFDAETETAARAKGEAVAGSRPASEAATSEAAAAELPPADVPASTPTADATPDPAGEVDRESG